MNRKSSISVIIIAVLMSIIAVIFLFFDKSAKAPISEVSTQVENSTVAPTSSVTPVSTPEDVLLNAPEDSLSVEDDSSVVGGGEGEELQLDTNF